MRITKAVIPAAGFGTRLYPATRLLMKELFPVVGPDGICRPALQYNIEQLVDAGIEQICIIVQPGGDALIKEYFSAPSPELKAKLTPHHVSLSERLQSLGRRLVFVFQEKQDGYGHAVYCAREFAGDEPFILLLGDHVFLNPGGPSCCEQMLDVQERYGASVTAVERVGADMLPYLGAIAGERLADDPGTIRVTEFKEKPDVEYAQKHLRVPGLAEGEYDCHFGIHAFTPGIFRQLDHMIADDLRERGEFQLTTAQHLLAQVEPYYAHEIAGQRCDVGLPHEYVKTIQRMAKPSDA